MLADGRGGFAMGTASDIPTRRYHGLLVCSQSGSLDRRLLLSSIDSTAEFDANAYPLSSNQFPGAIYPEGYQWLESFECAEDWVQWTFAVGGVKLVKHVSFVGDALVVRWSNDSKRPVRLVHRPLTASRSYHGNFSEDAGFPRDLRFEQDSFSLVHDGSWLRVDHPGAFRTSIEGWYYRFEHQREVERGLDARDDLYCPCELAYVLMPGDRCSIEFRSGLDSENTSTANAASAPTSDEPPWTSRFVVHPEKAVRVVAGYPWFTDWGRDTMISLPGLCLESGRQDWALELIQAHASAVDQGMIPNRIVENGEPEFNSIDATLWFVDAAYQTLSHTWNEPLASSVLEAIANIYAWHVKGTRFGIRVDPKDGLIGQGDHSEQLTWMDAKVGDWVVTPRRGKPIEISALWVHSMHVAKWIAEKLGHSSERFRTAAEKAESQFEKKYWRKSLGYYLDTAEPDDASLRPNQVIAMSLEFAPHHPANAVKALAVVEAELLTPFGLRTLAPADPYYRGRFEGPLKDLDAAYHQGTVWPWLLGPYVRAILKFTGDVDRAQRALGSVGEMMDSYGLGGIAEVYDGDSPHRPNGCPWQAWSAAEIRRASAEIERFRNRNQ